jgi:hypothetical protein
MRRHPQLAFEALNRLLLFDLLDFFLNLRTVF